MLSQQQLLAVSSQRRRPIRSLRQQYELFILDRIERYKNSLSREELMRIGNEAILDLRVPEDEQFLLTEVLAETAVDELIKRRLKLRGFESWRKTFPKVRAAQRHPTHWGLDQTHLVAGLAPRIEPDDPILVVGAGAESCAYLLAAHDGMITFLDHDLGIVDRSEHRVADESLSSSFLAMCVQFGKWLPCLAVGFTLVVLDAGTLAVLSPGERRVLLAELQDLTAPGGLHALVPDGSGTGTEGFAGHYATWQRESLPPAGRRARGAAPRGALFTKPMGVVAGRQEQSVRA